MKKRLWVAVIGLTLVTVVPPISTGLILFKVLKLTLLQGIAPIVVMALANTWLCNFVIRRTRPWVHGYDAAITLKAPVGSKFPKGTRFEDDKKRVWETVEDTETQSDGKVEFKLKQVVA